MPANAGSCLLCNSYSFIMFIAGMCRVWSKKQGGYWVTMPYAARGYSDCERLVEDYEDRFGSLYQYAITADHDLCRPCD